MNTPNVDTELSDEEIDKLMELLEKFRNCYSLTDHEIDEINQVHYTLQIYKERL